MRRTKVKGLYEPAQHDHVRRFGENAEQNLIVDQAVSDARQRVNMTDADIVHHFARLGYRVMIQQIAFVGETVEDFRQARSRRWYKAGRMKRNEPGLLVVEECQPRPGQRTRDVVVVSFGSSRAVMGVEIKPGAPPLKLGDATCLYAPTMEWARPEPVKPAAGTKLLVKA